MEDIKKTPKLPLKLPKMTYKQQKLFWAIIFLLPWAVGILLLFLVPFIESLRYSFFDLTPQAGEIVKEFIGFEITDMR